MFPVLIWSVLQQTLSFHWFFVSKTYTRYFLLCACVHSFEFTRDLKVNIQQWFLSLFTWFTIDNEKTVGFLFCQKIFWSMGKELCKNLATFRCFFFKRFQFEERLWYSAASLGRGRGFQVLNSLIQLLLVELYGGVGSGKEMWYPCNVVLLLPHLAFH